MSNLGTQQFSDIYGEVQQYVKDTGSTRLTVIKDVINRKLDGAAARIDWPQLLFVDESGLRDLNDTNLKTMESGEPEFPLPMGTGRLKGLQYQDRSGEFIEIVEAANLYESAGAELSTTGKPGLVAQIGMTAQVRRLSAAGAVTAYSDVAANDGVYTARVKYRRSTGLSNETVWEDLSGGFNTGVALDANVAAGYAIEMVMLPKEWTGNFELRDGSSNKLVTVPSIERPGSAANSQFSIHQHPLYRVWKVPDADYGLTVIIKRMPRRLTEDEDVPDLPIASYLVEAAIGEVLRQRGRADEAGPHDAEAETFLKMAAIQYINTKQTTIRPARGNVISQTQQRWRR